MDLSQLNQYRNKWTLIKSIITFLKKSAGREKFFKLIGYIAKCQKEFIKAFLLDPKAEESFMNLMVKKCDITYDTTSMTRKCLRLGTVLQDYQKLVQAQQKMIDVKCNQNASKEVQKRVELILIDAYLSIVGNLFDNLQFICQIKLIDNSRLDDQANFISGACSLISCCINIYTNYQDLKKKQAKKKQVNDEDILANKTQGQDDTFLNKMEIVKSLCDIPKNLTDMQVDISSKIVAPLGLISAFIGCYNIWELVL